MKNQQNTELSNNKSVNSICSLEKSIQIPVLNYDTKSYSMTSTRIRQIQEQTAYPDSLSVQQALLKVWNECCTQEQDKKYSEQDMAEAFMACWNANIPEGVECKFSFKEWLEQFKNK